MGNSFYTYIYMFWRYQMGNIFDIIISQCLSYMLVGLYFHDLNILTIFCFKENFRFIFFRFVFFLQTRFCDVLGLEWSLMVGFKRYSFLLSSLLFSFFLALSFYSGDIQYVVHLNIFHIFMFTLYAYIMYIKWGINLTLFMSLCVLLSCFYFSLMFCLKVKSFAIYMQSFLFLPKINFGCFYCSFIYELINEKVFYLKRDKHK